MKCPLEIIGEFSEFTNTCQDCSHYKDCLNKSYDNDKNDFLPSGDNFPTTAGEYYKVVKNRKEMIEKLLIDNLGKITNEDIIDLQIDIELYNKICRKDKIKRQYKKRKKKE